MDTQTRHHVHALIDQLPPVQLAAVEMLLQSMVDPLSRKLALAAFDDEPFTNEDRRAVAEADEWRKQQRSDSARSRAAGFRVDDGGLAEDGRPCLLKRPANGMAKVSPLPISKGGPSRDRPAYRDSDSSDTNVRQVVPYPCSGFYSKVGHPMYRHQANAQLAF